LTGCGHADGSPLKDMRNASGGELAVVQDSSAPWRVLSFQSRAGLRDRRRAKAFAVRVASHQRWVRAGRARPKARGKEAKMPDHKIGTREEWQAARDELVKLEGEQAKQNEEIKKKRLELPWVAVEKEYEFDTEEGKKTLAELFEGRSQLLAYNIMFGPDYKNGACPGCTNLGDGLDGSLVHLNHRDVTLICFSRAPIERLTAYKRRMGWQFPYVSTYNTDFAFDFGLALSEEQAEQIREVKELIDNPNEFLQEWSSQVGADLKDGLRENPSWIAFAREDGAVYHTYTVAAPDPFVAPYFSFLLERTPKAPPAEPRAWRKDEYPD
jgi:predicted dithiol-disulfide oxidoreductase (DUF899 family)